MNDYFARKFCVLVLVAGTILSAQAQVTIFSENFDPLSSAGSFQYTYVLGNTTSYSIGITPGVGVGGSAGLQFQIASTNSAGGTFGGAAIGYQNQTVSGNTSLNLSDYTLSFDAEATTGFLTIQIHTYDGQYSTGTFDGTLQTNVTSLASSFQHYALNLAGFSGSLGSLGPAGGTYQILLQYVVTIPQPPYTETAVIDNLALTMVPEPGALTLLGLGALVVGVWSKRIR